MCGNMIDIQSPTAEIRREKKEERRRRRKIETTGQKHNVHICYAGRPKWLSTRNGLWKCKWKHSPGRHYERAVSNNIMSTPQRNL